jgi:transposase
LVAGRTRFLERARKKGGPEIGPNPTDRGKAGSKHHLLTDARGIPLVAELSAANVNDGTLLEHMVDLVVAVSGGRRGRPRKRPGKLHADKAYRSRKNQALLRARNIKSRVARPKLDSSERLGRHRWVVERTLAWLHRFRRLRVRDERRGDIHEAFLHLAVALICWSCVVRLC